MGAKRAPAHREAFYQWIRREEADEDDIGVV
jgi:hypothetical protein